MSNVMLVLCHFNLHRWRWRTVKVLGFFGDINICTRCGKPNPDQRPYR